MVSMRTKVWPWTCCVHLVLVGLVAGSADFSYTDLNENEPIFAHSRYYASVPENATVGTSVLRATATDIDQGQAGLIGYTLYSKESGPGSGSPFFGINGKTGWIFVTRPLDYETQEVHELVVVAKDAGIVPLETSAFVSITVLNTNDNPPTIKLSFATENKEAAIAEDAKVGDLVARVSISDPDSRGKITGSADREEDRLSVSLSGADGHFALSQVNAFEFLVTVSSALDCEEKNKFNLTITASDDGQPPLVSSYSFILDIIDINDNPTFFDSSSYFTTVADGSPPGTFVYHVKAGDRDVSSAISYRLTNDQQLVDSAFAIDGHSGIITTRSRVTRDRYGSTIKLTVSASDGSSMSPVMTTVIVTISDINHGESVIGFANDPVLQVTEDCCSAGDVVMMFRVNITNGDFAIRYQVEPTNPVHFPSSPPSSSSPNGTNEHGDGDLTLDSQTGLLTLVRPFDYERKQGYKLNVSAAIYPKSQLQHVDQSAPAGGVHGHQGPSLYRAAVKVIWQLFYVQVVNTNDETPILLETEYRRLVPENCEPGTLILTIEASDPDGDDKLTYMIPDHHPTRQQFDLSSQTGELRTRAPLDRESQVVYRIPVYVFDSSRKHMTQTEVMVIVEDINESAPMFSVNNRNQAVRIPENILPSTIFHTVVASDRDLLLSSELLANPGPSGVPGHLAYRIVSGDPDNAFAIDSAKGDLWTTGHLDRERQSVYELVVEASDAHYSALCNLTVELIDIDDNVPIFAQSVYHATVNFSRATAMAAKEVEVVTVRAHDFDYGNSIYYTINVTSNKDAVYFNMDPNSGRITIAPWAAMQAHEVRSATLRDTMSRSTTLSFDVLALDIGSMYASHSSKATVHVTLTNVDSEPLPKFRSYPYAIMLDGHRSDYGLGSAIGKIEVDNMSSTSVLKMIEEQAGHRCSDFFHIDSQSGAVSVKKALNSNMYECYVAVDSSGAPAGGGHQPKPTWTLMQILFLKGTSSEMKARKATAFAVKVDLVESTPPTTRIMNLISRSKMPLLKTGQYQFHMGYSSLPDVDTYLDLQAKTGIISLKRQLDYETDPTTIELVVVAKKPNSPFDSPIYFNIAISLVNANDNPPKFTQDSYTAFVKEGEHRGTFVAHITAIDSDNLAQVIHSQLAYDVVEVRPSRGVSYHILDGNHDNAFIIDPPGSGVVKTNSVLDKEILGRYVLTIGATDDGLTSDPKSMPLSSTCTMEVNIIDLNDNAPVFPPYQEINVSEDLEVGSVVSTLTANDVDTYPLLTYFKQRAESVHDDTDDLFAVELFTGKIILKSPLRSSYKSQYKLNILASDSLHTAETQVVVKVKTGHAQSRPPPLVREHQYLLVNPLEDDCISSGGVNCELGRVNVINKNQSEELALSVIYRLSDDPSRSFYIDGHTGILYNNRSLKLVTNKLFPVTILTGYSQDGSHFVNDLLSRASLLVNVLKSDIRDDFDEYGQNFYNVEVPADKIGDVLLSFPLGTKYAYKLVSGNDANDFMLMRNNQLIRLRRSSTTEYKLEVEGTQKKGRGLKAKIIVNVTVLAQGTDLYIPKMLTVKIPDNASIGREVTSVRSDDDYLHNFKYFISAGNEFNHFHVDPNNGIITVNRQLDYDKFSHYQLVISATKSDRSELTIANVNVHILRTKDTSAARFPFSQPSIRASVDENMPIATKVIKLIDSVNPAHKFSLSETTGSRGPFALDTKSGYLVTTDIIDYESLDPPIYQLVLKSFDEEAPTKPISEVLLEIEVGSVDEYAPKFSHESYHFNATASVGMPFLKIGRVMASDRDLGADGKVQYYLRSSSPAMSLSKFRINPSTGLLSVSTLLADDLPPKHSSLIIEASSGRENSLSALTVVQITLKIVDDIASNRIYDGPLRPDDLTQPAVTPTSSSSIPGWILFLIVLLMLVTVVLLFSIVVIRLYHQQQEAMMGRSQCSFGMNTLLRKRGGGSSLDLGPEGTPTYVHHEGDHVMHAHHHHHGHHPGGYIISSAATAPPPCYNEVTLTSSNLEGRSASSGRGSAEDEEDVDEEIRMIIEGNDYYGDGTENDCADGRDSAVPTTAEYLARLGVAQHGDDEMVETLNENDDVMSEDLHNVKINRPTQFSSVRSCRTRAQGSKGRRNRSQSQREPEDWSQLCPDSVAIQAQEELVEAYSWDYLQNWCPQYQPLSSVFTEIAKLKGAEIDPNDSANHFYDSASINSRMETASTMSTSTTRSGGRRRHQAQASPMTNPLIQASSTSAFSPVRPM